MIEKGRKELLDLRRNLQGCDTFSLVEDIESEPRLVVGRVPDSERRSQALIEANRIGRTLGIVDSFYLIGIEPSDELKLFASYPFGIGRVDYYDRFHI